MHILAGQTVERDFADVDRLRVQQVRGFLSVRTEQRRSIDDRITEAGDDVRELVRQLVAEVRDFVTRRSEEHTSALQSLMRISYAVFCLKQKISRTLRKRI